MPNKDGTPTDAEKRRESFWARVAYNRMCRELREGRLSGIEVLGTKEHPVFLWKRPDQQETQTEKL